MFELHHGDCLEVMKDIPDKSIDMILCDLPYGTTACKWDVIIPFDLLWEQYNRVIKDNGAIVLFGAEPFSSQLRLSNIKNYKYDWIWDKIKGTGFLNAKRQPMRNHELISVFYKKQCTYNPQKTVLLLEYLIKTYTNEGETVLDNCMGSGSTGVAAIQNNRKFIGIELDRGYFDIAVARINEVR